MKGALFCGQAPDHQEGGYVLGNNGSQGHSGHVQMAADDEKQVENHVDHTGEGEEVQGPLGISLGPQHGRAEVIGQVGGHSQKINAQIYGGQVDDIGGGGHPFQQLTDHDHPEEHHGYAAGHGQGHGGVDALTHVVMPSRPQIPGHYHVGAHRQAHKQIDHQIDERGVGADRRQGLFSREAAHHHHICRIK